MLKLKNQSLYRFVYLSLANLELYLTFICEWYTFYINFTLKFLLLWQSCKYIFQLIRFNLSCIHLFHVQRILIRTLILNERTHSFWFLLYANLRIFYIVAFYCFKEKKMNSKTTWFFSKKTKRYTKMLTI